MIQFHNFQMMNNSFPIPYVNYHAFDFSHAMVFPQYFQTQPYFNFGIQAVNPNYSHPFCSIDSITQSILASNSTVREANSTTLQISKQIKENQNRQKISMTVPRTKFIEKKSKLKYLKKNTESNISNQVLGFLVDEKKSERWLLNLCKRENLNQRVVSPKFYQWMRIIKTQTKKYISKKVLLKLSIPSRQHLLLKEFEKLNITISENQLQFFCRAIQILMRVFLTHYSPLTVLTSKKIHRQGTSQHLMRRRQIKTYLEQQYTKL